jgi:hypothetical protein
MAKRSFSLQLRKMYSEQPVQLNLKGLGVVFALFVAGVVLFLGALSNDDLLWFLPYFNETPQRIVVYRSGCRVTLTAHDPGFDKLTAALNQSLSQVDGYEQGFGLSPDSYKQYTESWDAVQVFYAQRVKIHLPFRFGNPDSLFLPLDQYYGEARAVFGGVGGDYWAGALRLKSNRIINLTAESIPCPQ